MKFKVGDKVRLNKNIKNFTYGRAMVGYDEIGEIAYICGEIVDVNFTSHNGWIGLKSELELVKENKKFFKKLPNDYTGTIEVENGYIVGNEILDKEEKKYLSAVIRPFKDKVIYIEKCGEYAKKYISISIKGDTDLIFPNFERGTMYKGMKLNKKYTLKELGLYE